MMQYLIESLSPVERKVVRALRFCRDFDRIVEVSKLSDVEVMRALQWLENKKVLKYRRLVRRVINLDKNGILYLKKGFPEKRFLRLLDKEKDIMSIKNYFSDEEFNVCLGLLKSKGLIKLDENKVRITAQGKRYLKKKSLEELFLEKLPLELNKLKKEDLYAYNELKKRKDIVKDEIKKLIVIKLSSIGKELIKKRLRYDLIENLSSEIIKKGLWVGKKFRRYDVRINVPKISSGRKHFVNEVIEYIKRVWLEMGFKEMTGSLVQSSFWDLDALFVPQDHAARSMQDTFFIKDPEKGKLPKMFYRVKEVHESGGDTGSRGWGYSWDEEEAKKNLLRTHTTVLSAKVIASLKEEDLPAKFFAVGKVFRNETLDWKHLFEFYQVEGIVVDESANFRHLLGYLREYYNKLGFKKIRFRPSYYPYTEPSVDPVVFHPVRKEWIELGGAGIFRPEVVKPLFGRDIPVLAWGQGLERGIVEYYKIKDLRKVYSNDLKMLRDIKLWLK